MLQTLLGAALLAAGVLVSALADRIRAIRAIHREQASAPARERERERPTSPRPKREVEDSLAPGSSDVVAVLIAAGYRKPIAMKAVAACSPREQTSPESWTAAALRRCAEVAS